MLLQINSSADLEQKFLRLRDRWKRDTVHISSTTRQVMHPAYQAIIGMGPAVLPFLLRDVEQNAESWFWALAAIAEEDPAPEGVRGDRNAIAKAWLDWGRQKGIKW